MEWRISVRIMILTEICGPPPEVIRRNQNEPFHLNSDHNFWNLWHNGKHPGPLLTLHPIVHVVVNIFMVPDNFTRQGVFCY